MLTKTETGDTKWNTSNPAPSQSQAQHTRMAEGHRRDTPSWQFFRLVGCFFGSSSYCNDPLPAPAVKLSELLHEKNKQNPNHQLNGKSFSPRQNHRRSEPSSSYDHLSWSFTIKRWLIYSILNASLLSIQITDTLLTLREAQVAVPGADWPCHCIAISVCKHRDTPTPPYGHCGDRALTWKVWCTPHRWWICLTSLASTACMLNTSIRLSYNLIWVNALTSKWFVQKYTRWVFAIINTLRGFFV